MFLHCLVRNIARIWFLSKWTNEMNKNLHAAFSFKPFSSVVNGVIVVKKRYKTKSKISFSNRHKMNWNGGQLELEEFSSQLTMKLVVGSKFQRMA